MNKISLQEYADRIVAPEYKQPLKTVQEAVAANGWDWADRPICCGKEIEIRSFLGDAYMGECMTCGKFILDVSGPSFGNSWVNIIDGNLVEINTLNRWIASQRVEKIQKPVNPTPDPYATFAAQAWPEAFKSDPQHTREMAKSRILSQGYTAGIQMGELAHPDNG